MGTKTVVSGSNMPGIYNRFSAMSTKHVRIRRKVIKAKKFTTKRQVFIAKAYIMSKGLYNVPTYSRLSQVEAAKIHFGVMGIYRGIARLDAPSRSSAKVKDAQLIEDLKVQAPLTIVAQEQVMLFLRILTNKNPAMLHVLANVYKDGTDKDNSWLSVV